MQFASRQLFLERLVHALLALDTILADKLGADDKSLEMLAIAIQFKVVAGHAGEDELLDQFGMHAYQFLSFQPRLSKASVNRLVTAKQTATTARLRSGATSETPKKP